MNFIPALACVPALILASTLSVSAQSGEAQRACDAINMLAPLVVTQRESGASKADIMPYIEMAEGKVQTLIKQMIDDAFETDETPEAFQARWVRDCYASFD